MNTPPPVIFICFREALQELRSKTSDLNLPLLPMGRVVEVVLGSLKTYGPNGDKFAVIEGLVHEIVDDYSNHIDYIGLQSDEDLIDLFRLRITQFLHEVEMELFNSGIFYNGELTYRFKGFHDENTAVLEYAPKGRG